MRAWLRNLALAICWLYLLALGGWFAANRLLGDRWWWLFLASAAAFYLFAPLPLVGLIALAARRRGLLLGALAGAVLFLALYGVFWLPRLPQAAPTGPALTVMTTNLLAFNSCVSCVIASLRDSGADLITLQELSPEVAAAIARDLIQEYPYQLLDPQEQVFGLGAISRLPLRDTGETLPGTWVGRPQVLALTFAATQVLVVNAHPLATGPYPPEEIERTIRERYTLAQTLVAFARTHPGPLLYPGDNNTTDQNDAYRLLATAWTDSWREAGRGLGAIYPGTDFSGQGRFHLGPVLVPRWLVRIDYIWHSAHWRAVAARVGPWDGGSDHRPVVARLVLVAR